MALEGSRRRRIAVVCDSSVPLDAARSHGLLLPDAVVSLPILIEGERLDGRLSQAELGAQVAMAQASRLRVSTSRPTPEAFSTAFRDLEAQGYAGIVVVVISGRISEQHDVLTWTLACSWSGPTAPGLRILTPSGFSTSWMSWI